VSTTDISLACPYCGLIHGTVCPRVKAIEYHPGGTIKRVEFHDARTATPLNPVVVRTYNDRCPFSRDGCHSPQFSDGNDSCRCRNCGEQLYLIDGIARRDPED